GSNDDQRWGALVDLAFVFSPLVEKTSNDTVVLDVSGQDLLFGSPSSFDSAVPENPTIGSSRNIAGAMMQLATQLGLKVNVAVPANPDVAIHAARCLTGVTIVPPGEELSRLGSLSIKKLDYSLGGIEEQRAEEIAETLALWGIRTFGDFARLPLAGV